MKWPNHTDYQDAIQNPQVCFAEEDLKNGQAVCDALGLPRVMSGNFASVYELVTPQRRWAVRCFVRQVSGTQARYARLSQHLDSVSLPWLVNFEFILKGIMVQGDWYPIVKMEWVEGVPLNAYLDEHRNDSAGLLALAEQFRKLVSDLRQHKIAHGDFQHGNIMVTPQAELRLVDYDGMYCPAFGKGRAPELGHANFQHPLRLADYYDESLDNFSALVIYTSLLALAENPDLWTQFYTGDNLIFSSSDFRNTQNSKVFAKLKASQNPEIQQLAALLQQTCMSPVAFIPWFEETLVALKGGTLQTSISLLEAESGADTPPVPEQKGESWWETAKAHTTHFTRKILKGSRETASAAPSASGTRTAPAAGAPAGTRSSEPIKTGTRPVPSPLVPTPAPSLGSRPAAGTRPATGSRPSGTPISAVTVPSAMPATSSYASVESADSSDSGLGWKVKLAAIGLIILAIICVAIARSRSSNSQATPPAVESR